MVFIKLMLTIVLIVLTSMIIVLSVIMLSGKPDGKYWGYKIVVPILLCALDVYLWLYPWYNFVMF